MIGNIKIVNYRTETIKYQQIYISDACLYQTNKFFELLVEQNLDELYFSTIWTFYEPKPLINNQENNHQTS